MQVAGLVHTPYLFASAFHWPLIFVVGVAARTSVIVNLALQSLPSPSFKHNSALLFWTIGLFAAFNPVYVIPYVPVESSNEWLSEPDLPTWVQVVDPIWILSTATPAVVVLSFHSNFIWTIPLPVPPITKFALVESKVAVIVELFGMLSVSDVTGNVTGEDPSIAVLVIIVPLGAYTFLGLWILSTPTVG